MLVDKAFIMTKMGELHTIMFYLANASSTKYEFILVIVLPATIGRFPKLA